MHRIKVTFLAVAIATVIIAVCGTVFSKSRLFKPLPLPEPTEVYPGPVKWTGEWKNTTVLHIGDGQVTSELRSGLLTNLLSAGATYRVEHRVTESAKSWITDGRLKRVLKKHDPRVVIVTFDVEPRLTASSGRANTWVSTMVDIIGDRACYWIGPLGLREDKDQLNEWLVATTAPCHYIDPRSLKLNKKDLAKAQSKKKLRPKDKKRLWVEQVWQSMNKSL